MRPSPLSVRHRRALTFRTFFRPYPPPFFSLYTQVTLATLRSTWLYKQRAERRCHPARHTDKTSPKRARWAALLMPEPRRRCHRPGAGRPPRSRHAPCITRPRLAESGFGRSTYAYRVDPRHGGSAPGGTSAGTASVAAGLGARSSACGASQGLAPVGIDDDSTRHGRRQGLTDPYVRLVLGRTAVGVARQGTAVTDGLRTGDVVKDAANNRVGKIMGFEGPYVQCRPLGGGREWDARPERLKPASLTEALSAGVTEANTRSRHAAGLTAGSVPRADDKGLCAADDDPARSAECTLAVRPGYERLHSECRELQDVPLPRGLTRRADTPVRLRLSQRHRHLNGRPRGRHPPHGMPPSLTAPESPSCRRGSGMTGDDPGGQPQTRPEATGGRCPPTAWPPAPPPAAPPESGTASRRRSPAPPRGRSGPTPDRRRARRRRRA